MLQKELPVLLTLERIQMAVLVETVEQQIKFTKSDMHMQHKLQTPLLTNELTD